MSATFTELDAVNEMLTAVSQVPVQTLGSGSNAVATMAESILDESNREIQGEGWWFNFEEEVTYTVNANNEVELGDDVLHADGHGVDTNYVKRGNRLYDLENHRFTFSGETEIDLDVIRFLDWLDMPLAIRQFIAAKARRKLVQRWLKDTTATRIAQQEEDEMRVRAQNENARQADYNFLRDNDERFRMINRGGRGPIERGFI